REFAALGRPSLLLLDLLRRAGDVPAGRQLLERLSPAPARRAAAQPANQRPLGGRRLRRLLRLQLWDGDGGPGVDGGVSLFAHLSARRRIERIREVENLIKTD